MKKTFSTKTSKIALLKKKNKVRDVECCARISRFRLGGWRFDHWNCPTIGLFCFGSSQKIKRANRLQMRTNGTTKLAKQIVFHQAYFSSIVLSPPDCVFLAFNTQHAGIDQKKHSCRCKQKFNEKKDSTIVRKHRFFWTKWKRSRSFPQDRNMLTRSFPQDSWSWTVLSDKAND